MIRLQATTEWRRALACVLLSCLAGCSASFPWRKVPLDATSGLYEDAALTYRVDAGKLGQPLDVLRVEHQRVSHEQVASSPLPNESIGTLSIKYPHPAGKQGYALARFVLDSGRPKTETDEPGAIWTLLRRKADEPDVPKSVEGSQPEIHESWEMDIAHAELDAIFKMLANLGFYDKTRPGGAHLTVRMNGVAQSKDWDQIPVLNQLVQRVRSEGRLVSYSRPTMSTGTAHEVIASTAALHELAAGISRPGNTVPQVASAFALPHGFGTVDTSAGLGDVATAGPGPQSAHPPVAPLNRQPPPYPTRTAGHVEPPAYR